MITIDQIKKLREETDVSVTECKKALEKAGGDTKRAKEILREQGKKLAGKKSSREVKEGIVASYIHPNNKIGVMLKLRSETDFVAKSDDFQKLAHEICLQIAAMSPLFLKEEAIPDEFLNAEKKIYREQFKDSSKPQKIVDSIIEGKLEKYKKEISLLSQPWVKDNTKTIQDLIEEYITRFGENITAEKFVRYEI